MEWVETTGRTIEEAKDRALDRLGVDEQDADFEILEEPRTGLFGRLRAEARVRARVRPTTPRPKDDRRDKRRRKRPDGEHGAAGAASEASGDRRPEGRRRGGAPKPPGTSSSGAETSRAHGSTAGADRGSPITEVGGPEPEPVPAATSAVRSDEARRPPRRSGARRDGGGSAGNGGSPGRARDDSDADTEYPRSASYGADEGAGMHVALDEQAAVAKHFLDGLIDEMDLDAEVVIDPIDEETVEINVDGGDLGLLIGPKGATLLAIQDLTRTVVQRKTSAMNGRIMVDVSGYRHKRKEALERFARQVADQVKTEGVRKVLEPMSAADRKIVHDAINDIDGVSTTSEGEEPQRRVVILPAG